MEAEVRNGRRAAAEDAAGTSSTATGPSSTTAAASAASSSESRAAELQEKQLPAMLEAMWAANVMDMQGTVVKACWKVRAW